MPHKCCVPGFYPVGNIFFGVSKTDSLKTVEKSTRLIFQKNGFRECSICFKAWDIIISSWEYGEESSKY